VKQSLLLASNGLPRLRTNALEEKLYKRGCWEGGHRNAMEITASTHTKRANLQAGGYPLGPAIGRNICFRSTLPMLSTRTPRCRKGFAAESSSLRTSASYSVATPAGSGRIGAPSHLQTASSIDGMRSFPLETGRLKLTECAQSNYVRA
jgi:hypothetical protein